MSFLMSHRYTRAVVISSHSLSWKIFVGNGQLCVCEDQFISRWCFFKKMYLISKCWGFFQPLHHSQRSALFSAGENTVDTFCWYKLPLAEAYQIHQQTTGVLKCLGKIITVIVHILVITTFLTFIRWLLHMNKLADQLCCAKVARRDCSNTATVFRGTERQRGVQWSCLFLDKTY